METKIRKLAQEAGHLQCAFSADLNGTAAKTAKFQIIARTSGVLECPSWSTDENPNGRLVHDLSGMRVNKSEIPLLWNHNSMPIGIANRFELRDGNLVISGIIKSTNKDDLADAIITKLRAGLPFQASINFGDSRDGATEIEEYEAEEIAACNGNVYIGPLTVIRRWGLIEVSIVSLGQDDDTSVVVDPVEQAEPKNNGDMPQSETVVYAFTATVRDRSKCGKAEPIQSPKTELSKEPEPDPVEPKGVDTGEGVEGDLIVKYAGEFGAENAVRWFGIEKLSEQEARTKFCEQLKQENERLKQLAKQGNQEISFIPSDDPGKLRESRINELMTSGMSRGQAEYAAKNRR